MKNDIRTLIERFMAGQTSTEEESRLAEYFRTHDVDADLQPYKDMFGWFDDGMPVTEHTVGHTSLKGSPQAPKKKHTHRPLYFFVAAAAALALLLILAWPTAEQPRTADNSYRQPQTENRLPKTTQDTISADTATTATPKKKTQKHGIRIDRYKPMPPKTYMADKRRDSTYEAEYLMAEKKINEILQQQYDTLKEMEKMYRQMDIGLDIYTIALENYDCVEDEYY